MSREMEFTDDAKEALELLDYIREKGGVEEAEKFASAEAYIKNQGTVSDQFLARLKEERNRLKLL